MAPKFVVEPMNPLPVPFPTLAEVTAILSAAQRLNTTMGAGWTTPYGREKAHMLAVEIRDRAADLGWAIEAMEREI